MRPTRPAMKPRAGWALSAAPVYSGFSGETPLGLGEEEALGAAEGFDGLGMTPPEGLELEDGLGMVGML